LQLAQQNIIIIYKLKFNHPKNLNSIKNKKSNGSVFVASLVVATAMLAVNAPDTGAARVNIFNKD